MDGVFINITDKDVIIKDKDKNVLIEGNIDLVTPVRHIMKTHSLLSGIISTGLKDEDVHTIQSTQMFNTVYNKITRMEQNAPVIKVENICPYYKYPFTQEQIDKINSVSRGRTRLFVLTKEDAEFWSSGNFECPFRNYRLFVSTDNHLLIEYPIPKTYLDMVSSSLGSLAKKISVWQ